VALILDEAWSRVDPVKARAAGYSGVIGYVSEDATGKNITLAEIAAAHASGMDVGFVYEFANNAAHEGAMRGQRDGQIALIHARDLGIPAGVALYCAVDFDAQPADMPAVLAYARHFQSTVSLGGYRSGVYGSYAVCLMLHNNGYNGFLWQTYAWSHGLWSVGLSVRQLKNGISVAGANVDQDQTQVADWGQWPATGTPGSPERTVMGSIATDNIVRAWSEGVPSAKDDTGNPISVEPVKWRQRDEAWQATVTSALAALAAGLAQAGTGVGGLTDQQAADLHTIAEDLRKLTA